jgi:hypothetical protein
MEPGSHYHISKNNYDIYPNTTHAFLFPLKLCIKILDVHLFGDMILVEQYAACGNIQDAAVDVATLLA